MNRTDSVRTLKDINKDNLELILQSHYSRKDVKITEDSTSDLKQFEGNNDFYNSQIKKFSVKVCTSILLIVSRITLPQGKEESR